MRILILLSMLVVAQTSFAASVLDSEKAQTLKALVQNHPESARLKDVALYTGMNVVMAAHILKLEKEEPKPKGTYAQILANEISSLKCEMELVSDLETGIIKLVEIHKGLMPELGDHLLDRMIAEVEYKIEYLK